MNERIKELRKHLKLSGTEFGDKIGFTRMAISNLERGRYNATEQTIKSICREFGVSEEWLRHGVGDMFISSDTISLDELIASSTVDEFETQILKAYFSIDKELRKSLIKQFKEGR